MKAEQRIHQKQRQLLSPLMRRSLQLLQMPTAELSAYLELELQKNPVIEEADREFAEPGDKITAGTGADDAENWEDYYKSMSHFESIERDEGEDSYPDGLPAEKPGLHDWLMSQLNISGMEHADIGGHIISNIDRDGYLRASVGEMAAFLGEEPEKVERVLGEIRLFDPPGVAARNLRECLLIQMGFKNEKNELAFRIVKDYFRELRARKVPALARLLETTEKDIVRAMDFISCLNPRPGASFPGGESPAVVPDVILKKISGKYEVIHNDDRIPRLRVSGFYQRLLKKDIPAETYRYISGRIKAAEWLIKAIEKRRQTIQSVVGCIVGKQENFFEKSGADIMPLKLEDIALATDLNKSTVSRVVSNKYIETERGIFPLKFFFSGRSGGESGRGLSSKTVRARIASIIEEENPRSPLSDADISELLRRERINVARRTVAKYREEQKIPPARLRKKYV